MNKIMSRIKSFSFFCIFFLLGLISDSSLALASTNPINSTTPYQAGVSVADITPCTNLFDRLGICPSDSIRVDVETLLMFWGTGTTEAISIERPVSVRAFAIADSNNRRMVFVSADVHAFDAEFAQEIRARVGLSRGLAPEEVLINGTHTHNVPALRRWPAAGIEPNQQYAEGVMSKTVQAIEQAIDRMVPASLLFGTGASSIGVYRRSDGYFLNNTPYNQRVDVLEAQNSFGTTLAVAFFYGCHPVNTLFLNKISPDYPGVARAYVEERLRNSGSPDATAIFFQGFGGDINPYEFAYPDSSRPSLEQQMTKTGEDLGQSVIEARSFMNPLSGS
ncbi:MAG: neutral/alkaline non-lysosomal ceramidase N-terminal domain-containing protein, partial [Acidobacteriota bacterium]|nr:neutral/alkaline non-lysosomal ceramidase N-terminal domain-containing protein [Acidobacteriota bacterium]